VQTPSEEAEATRKEARRQKVFARREAARLRAREAAAERTVQEEHAKRRLNTEEDQQRRQRSRAAFQERQKEAEELESRRKAEREKRQPQQYEQYRQQCQAKAAQPASPQYGYFRPQATTWQHAQSVGADQHQQQKSVPFKTAGSFSQTIRNQPTPQPQEQPFHHSSSFKQQPLPSFASALPPPHTDSASTEQDPTSNIKRNILTRWALHPPSCHDLRPIEVLLSTLDVVLPPAFGVKAHIYFCKWKPIARDDLMTLSRVEEEKLKRAVRKVRFFLHPDKLPPDFTEEQQMVCKMVWDIISDAWERHKSGVSTS